MDNSSTLPETLPEEFALLRRCLRGITDPRHRRGRVHPLEGVLSLSVLGLMAGHQSLSAIHRFGQTHPELLAPLGLRRSPSVATLGRLLRLVEVAQIRRALLSFAQELLRRRHQWKAMSVSVDGKTLRGVWEGGQQLKLLHLFSQEAAMALDQATLMYHTDEPSVAQKWVETVSEQFPGLDVLTGDALFANRDYCDAILAQGKDYVVKLKKTSQPSMKQ